MKFLHVLIFTIFFLSSISAQNEKGYEGYRVYFSNAEVISSKKKSFKVKFRQTNTGSKLLSKETRAEYQDNLILKVDEGIKNTSIAQYEKLIIEKLKNEKFNLKPGQSESAEYKIKIPKELRGKEVFTVNTGGGNNNGFNRKLCPDLVMDSLVLVKKDPKNAYIKFKITNTGKGAINIIGDKKNVEDNIMVRAYFAGSPKFSRGAIPADEMYLKGLKETQGILFPGESISGEMKISRKKQTKYNKVLIVFVDANQIVMECNETNNRDSVLVK